MSSAAEKIELVPEPKSKNKLARPNLKALTGIRFFLAFHVVILHSEFLSGWEYPVYLRGLIFSGSAAVGFFFVLSGFILTYVYCDEDSFKFKGTKRNFWIARLARIYPVYLLGLLLDLPSGIQNFFAANGTAAAILKSGAGILAHLTAIQSWSPRLASNFNFPAWSISVETFFYLSFPAIILFALPKISMRKFVFLTFGLWTVHCSIVASIVYMGEGTAADSLEVFPLFRIAEFLVGMVFGFSFLKRKTATSITSTLFLVSIACVLGIWSLGLPHIVRASGVLAPLYGICILSLARSSGQFKMLGSSTMVLLGNASYAMYIIHVPILHIVERNIEIESDASPLLFISYIVFLILCSIAVFKLYEVYVQKWIRNRFMGRIS